MDCFRGKHEAYACDQAGDDDVDNERNCSTCPRHKNACYERDRSACDCSSDVVGHCDTGVSGACVEEFGHKARLGRVAHRVTDTEHQGHAQENQHTVIGGQQPEEWEGVEHHEQGTGHQNDLAAVPVGENRCSRDADEMTRRSYAQCDHHETR